MSRLTALLRSLPFRSNNIETLWVRADLASANGNHRRAKRIYRQLARRKLDSPTAYLYAGLSAHRLHRTNQAITIFEAGLQKYRDPPLLLEYYMHVCAELNQVDHIARRLANKNMDGRRTCEELFDRFTDPRNQATLIDYALRNGYLDLIEPRVASLLQHTNDISLLWQLADVLLQHQRTGEARSIYLRLAAHPVKDSIGALYAALSEHRLGNTEHAIEIFEAGIEKFPRAKDLAKYFVIICAQTRQINRVIRFIVPAAKSELHACKVMFAKFSDPQIQVGLIDHCLTVGLDQLADQKILAIQERSNNTLALWQVSQLFLSRGRTDDANAIHRRLTERTPKTAEDYHLSSWAFVCLSEMEACLERLEQGLRHHSTDGNLLSLYINICAQRSEYDRYRDFLNSLGAGALSPPVSMLDFYRRSMSEPINFVIIFPEIERHLSKRDGSILSEDFHTYLRKNPPSIQNAKLLIFFCRYLHLPESFSEGVFDALRMTFESNDKEIRSINILNDMTPPMIPRCAIQAEVDVRRFIEAGHRFSANPMLLGEPIADMTNNWTPWQYIFCLVVPNSYSKAIAAFEKLAFHTWPSLNFTAKHIADAVDLRNRRRKKLRLGFIVHDSMPMMSGFLPRLDKEQFETVFLRPGKMGKSATALDWLSRAGKVVEYSDVDMRAAIETIANEELDIIVSGPSIAAVYYPMMARLAPLQMVLLEPNWTDGLTHADYYISWQPAEPANPSDFYKTKVSLFQHPPYWIEKSKIAAREPIDPEAHAAIRKRLLNVGPETRVYLCANTPPKIHPDMDEVFREILERDKNAILVLLRGEYPPARTLKVRLRETLGSHFDRIIFLPTINQEDAHMLLQSVDCCLDSFPICGMSSSFDGAMLGIPTVTLPGNIPFSRWTTAIYEYIGITVLIAKNRKDYIDLALRLASDKPWRDQLSLDIKQKSSRYVENELSLQELESFLLGAWDRKLQGLPPMNWINGRWQDLSGT